MPCLLATGMKKVLIVYAHQSSNSFNASVSQIAKKVLENQGCTVEVSDLYALGSKDVAGKADASPMILCPFLWKPLLDSGLLSLQLTPSLAIWRNRWTFLRSSAN